ncbi:MAG: hypothetical protein ACREOH_18125 [Candidatus Entotheonellia bacterium]
MPPSDGTHTRRVVLRFDEPREGEARCRAILPNGERCPRRAIPEYRGGLHNGRPVAIRIPPEKAKGLCSLHDSHEEWDRRYRYHP